MRYLIGTDEAGYGPNLGPLVVAATVWELRGREAEAGLFRAPPPGSAAEAIADSKTLYQPGKGLRLLERGVLAALGVLGRWPASWCDVWEALDPRAGATLAADPCYAGYRARVPVEGDGEDVRALARSLHDDWTTDGVRLVEVRCRAVFPEEFNALCEEHGNKATALSHATLDLAAKMMQSLDAAPVAVLCDKHGGRNRYADLLAGHFPAAFIQIHGESRALSVYRFASAGRQLEFRFQSKGDSHAPAALASMTAKYLRELAMRAFNEYWLAQVPGLSPTAGYPADAKRFKRAIAARQAELGVSDRALWRAR